MQRQHVDAAPINRRPQLGDGSLNLGDAWKEAQHVAGRRGEQFLGSGSHRLLRWVRDVERVHAAFDGDDRTSAEELRYGRRVDRRRHDHDAQIISDPPGLTCERQREIGVDASLVKLVEHDGAKVGKQRIALQPRGQDAFGSDEEPCIGAEAAFETHVPADLASNRPAALGRDVLGDGAGGHTPRLENDDRTVWNEGGRYSRRFAGARRRRDDHGARPVQGILNLGDEWIDG